mgnify:CR=1 FL=1
MFLDGLQMSEGHFSETKTEVSIVMILHLCDLFNFLRLIRWTYTLLAFILHILGGQSLTKGIRYL